MKKINNKNGYTIIETMIAISVFLVVVMIGMGALLNADLINQKSGDMRSILDNISFVMDDMSTSLRTGTNYYCINSGTAGTSLGSIVATSGQNCWGIAFKSAGPNSQEWGYEIVSQTSAGVTTYSIIRSEDGGATWVTLTPPEVVVTGNVAGVQISGFSVLGAEPLSAGNKQQPFVTIRLVGTITYKNVVSPFSFQTSVSQRDIDIQ